MENYGNKEEIVAPAIIEKNPTDKRFGSGGFFRQVNRSLDGRIFIG
jgi:hypothetical protein